MKSSRLVETQQRDGRNSNEVSGEYTVASWVKVDQNQKLVTEPCGMTKSKKGIINVHIYICMYTYMHEGPNRPRLIP